MDGGSGVLLGAPDSPEKGELGTGFAVVALGDACVMSERRLTETHPLPWAYIERTGELLDADGAPLVRIDPADPYASRLGALLANAPVLHELLRQMTGHLAWTSLGRDPDVDDLVRQAMAALRRAAPPGPPPDADEP